MVFFEINWDLFDKYNINYNFTKEDFYNNKVELFIILNEEEDIVVSISNYSKGDIKANNFVVPLNKWKFPLDSNQIKLFITTIFEKIDTYRHLVG